MKLDRRGYIPLGRKNYWAEAELLTTPKAAVVVGVFKVSAEDRRIKAMVDKAVTAPVDHRVGVGVRDTPKAA